MNRCTSEFQQLTLNLVYSFDEPEDQVYSFDDPEDQVSIFSKLVVECINIHTPLRKVKPTRPVAPWMNYP